MDRTANRGARKLEMLNVEALVSLEDEEDYKQKQRARLRRAAKWLVDPSTSLLQGISLRCIMPLVLFLGRLFDDSKVESDKSILEFCLSYRSPARRAVQR